VAIISALIDLSVIDALIDICKHEEEQAVQCTYLVHYKGKADVKKGTYSFLCNIFNRDIIKNLHKILVILTCIN